MDNRRIARLGAALAAGLVLVTSVAQAQPRREERERRDERERREPQRFRTPHLIYDNRYQHNRYYPALGYRVDVLPPGNFAITFRGGRFWFQSGAWYRRVGQQYVVVRPPAGILVPVLPPGYSVVYFGGVPYYYANDVYYVQQPSGYEVVTPPPAAEPAGPAPGAPAAQSPGTWYYCESAKAYYPYVAQCPEGWKSVPAAPPPAQPR